MVSVILALLAIICGGAAYPVGQQSHNLGLVTALAGVVFAILGIVASSKSSASDKDRTDKKEGAWLSIAGGILSVIVGAIVLFAK